MAFTAAVCSENFIVGLLLFSDQMHSWLSLPPDASWRLSGDHLRPHTSERCAEHLRRHGTVSAAGCNDPASAAGCSCAASADCSKACMHRSAASAPLPLALLASHGCVRTCGSALYKHEACADRGGGWQRTFAQRSPVHAHRAAAQSGRASQWREGGNSRPWCQHAPCGQSCCGSA
jgi:hypothetical protein